MIIRVSIIIHRLLIPEEIKPWIWEKLKIHLLELNFLWVLFIMDFVFHNSKSQLLHVGNRKYILFYAQTHKRLIQTEVNKKNKELLKIPQTKISN